MASKQTKEFNKNSAMLKESNSISRGLKRKRVEIVPEFTRMTRSAAKKKNIQSENQCSDELLMPAKKLAKKTKHKSVPQSNQSPVEASLNKKVFS